MSSTPPSLPNDPQQLHEKIRTIARSVAAGLGIPLSREDLIEDTVSHVWTRLLEGKYNPTQGPFAAWCRRVCKNYLLDQIQPREITWTDLLAHSRGGSAGENNGDNDRTFSIEELFASSYNSPQVSLFAMPFCPDDLDKVRKWKPMRDRVIMLAASGLWVKAPEDEWNEWVQQVRENGTPLPNPFPPPEFLNLEDPSDRLGELAKMTRLSRNHLAVLWPRRCRQWLTKLRCIREVREE
ncbi:hypothetical protein HRbin36_00576 [bacterium HR36]|nr:hypothetical protein HRbin36_00576 [bacterium HR36]